MSTININKNNFQEEVMQSDKPVLLDFWAPWCGPCRMVGPILEDIAQERNDIKVGKVNVDEQPELAGQFGVMSIPTMVVMKNGKVVNQAMGARPKSQILSLFCEVGRHGIFRFSDGPQHKPGRERVPGDARRGPAGRTHAPGVRCGPHPRQPKRAAPDH